MNYKHIPVMLNEVMAYLKPCPGKSYLDGTLGGGGYTEALAGKILPDGKVLAVDLDEMAINNFKQKISDFKFKNIILVRGNFKNLKDIVNEYFNSGRFDGIVLDLGLSSAQLDDRSRGFSFNSADSPLGMNFGESEFKADEIINRWEEKDLVKIFKDYGEEKFAVKIARAIIGHRQTGKITTTGQLTEIIAGAIPKRPEKIHPATKIFQALRLAVNQELENLSQALPQAVDLLKPGGRLAVVSYHSLEDRIVKQYFKQAAKDCLCPPQFPVCRCGHRASLKIITRGVLRPTGEEVLKNPRARSAKLRVAEKA